MIVTHQSGGVIGTTPYPRYMIVTHQSGGVIGTTPYPRYMIVTHQSGGVIGTTPLPQVHDRHPPVRWCDRNHPPTPGT